MENKIKEYIKSWNLDCSISTENGFYEITLDCDAEAYKNLFMYCDFGKKLSEFAGVNGFGYGCTFKNDGTKHKQSLLEPDIIFIGVLAISAVCFLAYYFINVQY